MTFNRRIVQRALLVFVLAAIAAMAFSVMLGDGAVAAQSAALELVDDTGDAVETTDPAAPTPAGTNRVLQVLLQGTIFGLLLALASVGLSLIYGTTGLSNFAHAEQVSFGAVLTY